MRTILPPLTLVIGGAASGKSAFAEELTQSARLPKTYIATGQAFDTEMGRKINAHVVRRGPNWTTVEAPLDVVPVLQARTDAEVCLLDCATFWLTNLMLANRDIETEQIRLLAALSVCAAPIVVVSNEVGQGIVPETSLGRRFRQAQGQLNIALAVQADLVLQVVVGLPQILKGTMP